MDEKDYEEVHSFVQHNKYPSEITTKSEKRNFRRKCAPFRNSEGKLFYQGKQTMVQVLKKGEVEHVLNSTHAAEHGGHLGVHKTWEKISSRFYWKGCYDEVSNYIKTCDQCQKKADLKKAKKPLRPIAVPSEAFNQVGMDLIGPLETTADGNKYIAVFTDYFTKWVDAEAIPDKSAEQVTRVFVKFICTHGCPSTLITDQGREFCNSLNDHICKQMGIDHRVASAYHPQTGGHTERFNRTLCNMLANYVNKEQNDWDLKLPFVLFAYRTAKHSSTKETPFYLVFGRAPRLPLELDISSTNVSETENYEEMLKLRCDSFLKLSLQREMTHANIKKAQGKQKKYHDAAITEETFIVGDKVLVHNTRNIARKGGKLQPKWKGPYTIRKKSAKGTFYLDGIKAPINGSRLALYKIEKEPSVDQCKEKINGTVSPKKRCQNSSQVNDAKLDDSRDGEIKLPIKKRKIVSTDSVILDHTEEQSTLYFAPVDKEWQEKTSELFEGSVKKQLKTIKAKTVSRNSKPLKTALIRGDGNCLFRTFSHVVFGVQTHYNLVRNRLVTYIRENEDIMKQSTPGPVNKYLFETNMSKDTTWGTEVEIFAFASITSTPVYVFSRYGEEMKWLEYKPLTAGKSTTKAVFIQNVNQHFAPVLDIQD